MNIYDYAMQMEKDGEAFYRQIGRQSNSKGLQAITTMLADDEVQHYKVVQALKEKAPPQADSQVLAKAKNVFVQMRERGEFDLDVSQIELWKKAQELEEKSRAFYQEKSEEVKEAREKATFCQLAEVEKKHYFLLENIINLLQRPQTWLEDAEWHHLDVY